MNIRFISLSLFLLAGVLMPQSTYAATLSFETLSNTVTVGDTAVVRVYLDSDVDKLNAVDGELIVSEGTTHLSGTEISVVQSALSMWAKSPTVSADKTRVTFTGGTPGGITTAHALLLTLIVKPTHVGSLSVTAMNVTAYKNDGKGTAVPVSVRPFSFTVAPHVPGTPQRDEWKDTVGVDTTAPEPFTIAFGSDPSVFDGKKFITYQTTDSQSGIDHYEVQEGNRSPVTANAPYVLIEQSASESITVFAYDKAGNVQTATYTTGTSVPSYLPWIITLIGILLAAVVFILIGKRRRNI